MRMSRIVDAMNDIDDDLVIGAIEYRPSKLKTAWFRFVGIAACLCLIVFGTIRIFDDKQPQPHTDTMEYGILAEVIEVLDSGRYKVKVTGEDQNFPNGSIVILNNEFHYISNGLEEGYLKTGDIIAVTYSKYDNTKTVYEITPGQIEIIQ